MKPRTRSGARAALGALTAAVLAISAPVLAADDADTTPPQVAVDPWARPLVGSQVDTGYEAGGLVFWHAHFVLSWNVTDEGSGVCAQQVAWSGYESLGGDADPLLNAPTTYYDVGPDARTFVAATDSFDWQRLRDRFAVRVTDCAGNVGTSGIAESELPLRDDDESGIEYRGSWWIIGAENASGGGLHVTRRRGSSASVDVEGGRPVALLMTKSPGGGRLAVLVDDERVAVVDTRAARTRHRVVVWSDLLEPGIHTVRFVNRATRGRPRAAIDGIVFCSGTSSGPSCAGP